MQDKTQLDRTTKFLIFILIFVSWIMIAFILSALLFGLVFGILWLIDVNISDNILILITFFSTICGMLISFFINRDRLRNPQIIDIVTHSSYSDYKRYQQYY